MWGSKGVSRFATVYRVCLWICINVVKMLKVGVFFFFNLRFKFTWVFS